MATVRYCAACAGERVFEQPPCEDQHGLNCPDWVCVDCGAAIFAGFLPTSVSEPDAIRAPATAA